MAKIQQIVDKETGEVETSRVIKSNSNFVQFYRNEMASIRTLAMDDSKAAALFLYLAEHMDTENALVVSRETIAEQLEWSVPTVDRKIKSLKEKGFITTVKSGTSNIYMINANLVWTSNGTKREYAKFKAQVLISKSEQDYRVKTTRLKQLDLLDN
jgi:biotin operon repressor